MSCLATGCSHSLPPLASACGLSATRSTPAAAAARGLAIVLLLLGAQAAWAFSAGLDAFRTRYVAATALHNCAVCHTSASQPFPLQGSPQRSTNAYGQAWRLALQAAGAPAPPGQSLSQGMQALAARNAGERFGLDQSRLDLVRRHTHRFLMAIHESSYDSWPKMPVLMAGKAMVLTMLSCARRNTAR